MPLHDPRQYLKYSIYKSLHELVVGCSRMYNLETNFRAPGFITNSDVGNLKRLACELDANGDIDAVADFFDEDTTELLAAKRQVVFHEGRIRFAPGYLLDACLDTVKGNWPMLFRLEAEDRAHMSRNIADLFSH
jgi:hypothetical protein